MTQHANRLITILLWICDNREQDGWNIMLFLSGLLVT
jgi:hypothetical protein